jgi:DNA-binding transcriptional ArsR family regulator
MSKQPLLQFQALASKPRLQIIRYIAISVQYCDLEETRPFSGNYLQALQQRLKLSKATLSHHISMLQSSKLVRSIKHGRLQLLFLDTAGFEVIKEFIGSFETKPHAKAKLLTVFSFQKLDSNLIKSLLEYVHLHGWKVSKRIMLPDPLFERYYLLWQEAPLLRLHFDIRTSDLTVVQLSNTPEHAERIQAALDLLAKMKIS